MSKLIDEYEAKKKIYDFHKITSVYENLCNNDLDVVMLLEELPEAVVRCKDCKWFRPAPGEDGEDWCKNESVDMLTIPMPDFYCAFGERKET